MFCRFVVVVLSSFLFINFIIDQFRVSQGCVRVMSGSCQGIIRVMSYQGHVGVMSGSYQGHVGVMLGHVGVM